jgi:hypothetical protein
MELLEMKKYYQNDIRITINPDSNKIKFNKKIVLPAMLNHDENSDISMEIDIDFLNRIINDVGSEEHMKPSLKAPSFEQIEGRMKRYNKEPDYKSMWRDLKNNICLCFPTSVSSTRDSLKRIDKLIIHIEENYAKS